MQNSFGKWHVVDGSLQLDYLGKSSPAMMLFTYDAPEEYDLRAIIERLDGDRGLVLGLTGGVSKFLIRLEYGTFEQAHIDWIDDGTHQLLRSTRGDSALVVGRKHDVRIEVRRTGVAIVFDGKEILRYGGPLSRLSRESASEKLDFPSWFLRAYDSFRFHKLELTPVHDDPSSVSITASKAEASAPPPAVAPFDATQARKHQEAWAKHLGVPIEFENSVGMKFTLIPPGEFLMGSSDEEVAIAKKMADGEKADGEDQAAEKTIVERERPQHRVRLTKPFQFGTHEVTLAQFRQFVAATAYTTEAERYGFGNSSVVPSKEFDASNMKKFTWQSPGYAAVDESAVTQVTWNDVCAFCNWLSERENLEPCYVADGQGGWIASATSRAYRLPTEAQWEFACRGGTTTQFSFGDDPAKFGEYGWFSRSAGNGMRPVGLLLPNPFGLFDMHGNVEEWCEDWYDVYLGKAPATNPLGASAGTNRVLRGGAWNIRPSHSRSARRDPHSPSFRYSNSGFRVVREMAALALSPKPAQPETTAAIAWRATPAQQEFFDAVAKLSADAQALAVEKKLQEVNPGFTTKLTPRIESGKVVEVRLKTTGVTQLWPLRALTDLQELNASGYYTEKSELTDLSPLRGMPLTKLICLRNPIVDLTPLRGMPLTELDCTYTRVEDLTPLAGMRLVKLSCLHSPVRDLSPLKGMPLTDLQIGFTRVADLSPLAGMPLTSVGCVDTNVTDLMPLVQCKALTSLKLSDKLLSATALEAFQKSLPNCGITWNGPPVAGIKTTPVLAGADESASPPPAVAPFNAGQARDHQKAWANHLQTSIEMTNSIGMKFVLIPPGEFLMGSDTLEAVLKNDAMIDTPINERRSELPQHRVVLTRPIWMSANEVTAGQFKQYLDAISPAELDTELTSLKKQQAVQPDNHPVVMVPWNRAVSFCEWLTTHDVGSPQTSTPNRYRLPTEAEWEFPCRAGSARSHFWDELADKQQSSYVWHKGNSRAKMHPVGQLAPNPFGLFDIQGNAAEWVQDWYSDNYYASSPRAEPSGPVDGTVHVRRGGDWTHGIGYSRSAYRTGVAGADNVSGFRIVGEIPGAANSK